MATNFTQFTSDASPSGGVVLVGHNIAGTGEIKTTIDQILSAMNLATDSDASFNSLSLSGNVSLSDSATIDVGSGTGTLEVDGTLKTKLEIAGSYSNNLKLEGHGGLNYACRFSGTSGVLLDLSLNGANSYLNLSRSGSYFSANNARLYHEGTGHFSIQDDASNLGTLELADIIASGDINLSDGSTIGVGGGTGEVAIDGDINVFGDVKASHPNYNYLEGKFYVSGSNVLEIMYGTRLAFQAAASNLTKIFGQTTDTYVAASGSAIDLKTRHSGQLKINEHYNGKDLAFYSNGGGNKILSVHANANADSFILDSNSNVGIGVAAPTVELDVLGDAKISGDITQGGNAVLDESYFTPQTLTDGATIAYDVSSGVNAKVTLGGDRTLAAITNAAEGQSGSLTVIQDATGGRALTLDASQTDMLGTLADIAGMGANQECEIAWRKTDSTNCKFWITIPA
jgi:hypothetical protein